MRENIDQVAQVAFDLKRKAPSSIDAAWPDIMSPVVLLGPKRRMAEITQKVSELFPKVTLDLLGRFLK
ncbi:hypothetical protein MYX65_10115 [Acidobacteria bacterium AH-259-L09]|nr:hypothetical protein [Acidobacteria bacterium AH-259-L09]